MNSEQNPGDSLSADKAAGRNTESLRSPERGDRRSKKGNPNNSGRKRSSLNPFLANVFAITTTMKRLVVRRGWNKHGRRRSILRIRLPSRYFNQKQCEAGYKAKSHFRGEREAVSGSWRDVSPQRLRDSPRPSRLLSFLVIFKAILDQQSCHADVNAWLCRLAIRVQTQDRWMSKYEKAAHKVHVRGDPRTVSVRVY